jgi:hypothetical protein
VICATGGAATCAVGGSIAASVSGIGGTSETWVRAVPGGRGGATLEDLLRIGKLMEGDSALAGSMAGDCVAGIPVSTSTDAREIGVGWRDGIAGRSIGSSPPVPPWSGVAS